jgi:hypothetical protein
MDNICNSVGPSHTPGEPEDGVKLLHDLEDHINRYVKLPAAASVALAAYIPHTHLAPYLDVVAYAHIYSAEKGCGKTVLMNVLRPLCARSLNVGDASVAFIARSLRTPRTVFMDELDALFHGDKERAQLLRGILDQGNRKDGTYGRCEPPKYDPVEFPVFGPVVFAGIGRRKLADTLRDRAIGIPMERMLPEDSVEPLFERTSRDLSVPLRARVAGWTSEHADAVVARVGELYMQRREEPVLVRLSTHAFEAWVPLVAICDTVGGDWSQRIRSAALELALDEDTEDRSHKERLLANIFDIFETEGDRVPSIDLVHKLNQNPEWEWSEWNRGKGLTSRQAAEMLREFRIRPRTLREGSATFKGYEREWFERSWKAYRIPPLSLAPDADPSLPSQFNGHAGSRVVFNPSQGPDVTDAAGDSITDEMGFVTDVTRDGQTPDVLPEDEELAWEVIDKMRRERDES